MSLLKETSKSLSLDGLNISELELLADDLRKYIIDIVAKNGGHLAPNLGVIELTMALHYIYNLPKDKIIWDVGHQSYAHKILTGRYDEFKTLRQYKGLSGFPKRAESRYDSFNTGHSSTSISAALGFALANKYKNKKDDVIAVIGDGAMTGGMAFEALNHAGHSKEKITVVLNDNRMSISENVGAMSAYLNRVRSDPFYTKKKEDFEYVLKKLPTIGPKVMRIADKLKDSFRSLFIPGMLFEELGFKYFGPIDGHNFKELIKTFENVKKLDRPVIVHVLTEKGRGYLPAKKYPDRFHGTGPFDIKTGKVVSDSNQNPKYTDIFSDTLIKLAKKDEKIIAITAAMGTGTGTEKFAEFFPERFIDVGIAEQHAVTMSAALALDGLKPVVAIYSTFLQRAYDQIVHDVCLQDAPVSFIIDRAGIVGEDGATHHGLFDISYLRHIPNLVLMAPKDENELQSMLYTSINYPHPTAIRFPRGRGLGVVLDEKIKKIEVGKGELLSEGDDLLLIALGSMVSSATEVRDRLKREKNIESTIINARFIKPLDQKLLLNQMRKHENIVVLEENVLAGGFGSSILELANDKDLNKKIIRFGIEDCFVEHGKTGLLKEKYKIDTESIYIRIINEFFNIRG